MGHRLTQTAVALLLCGLMATAPIAGATTVNHQEQPTKQSSLEPTETTFAIQSGNGTEVNPYVITNASGLAAIRDDLDAHYVLGSDIDATETATWNNGSGFEPIGTFATPFTGTIDGENHTIEGLTIDRPSTSGVALVGYASESSITNLRLTDATITGDFTTAALAGSTTDTVIREVTVSGSISGSGTVAGVVASTDGGTVEHVDATVTVESPGSAGGLVGENEGTVSDVVVSGRITGGTYVGGIAAQNPGTIERAAVNATVVGTTDDTSVATGGLVGYNSGNITATHAHGRVSGTNYVGGLVGSSNYESGVVANSYATANVTGESTVGGLVGGLYYGSSVTESYWNEQTSGQATSAAAGNGSVGLSTAAMTGEAATSNLTALDFAETWQVTSGAYPDLVGVGGDSYLASVDDNEGGDTQTAAISIADQTVPAGTTTVTVESATYEVTDDGTTVGDPFYVVVHERTADGTLSAPIGNSTRLSPGTHSDVPVRLGVDASSSDSLDALTTNTTLVAMLHRSDADTATVGTPVEINNSTVTQTAAITVTDSEPTLDVVPGGATAPPGGIAELPTGITNEGDESASVSLAFTDFPGETVTDTDAAGGTWNTSDYSWQLDELSPGSYTDPRFAFRVPENATPGRYTATATVTSNGTTREVTYPVTVATASDLRLTVGNATVPTGTDVTVQAQTSPASGGVYYAGNVAYDPSVVELQRVTAEEHAVFYETDTENGTAFFSVQNTGDGYLQDPVVNLTFETTGANGSTSPIEVTNPELFTNGENYANYPVDNGSIHIESSETDEPTPLGLNATTELVDSDLVLTVTANESLDSLEAVLASTETVYQETITLDAFSETQDGSTYVYTTRYVNTDDGEYTLDVSASDDTGAQTDLTQTLTVGDEPTAPTVDLAISAVDAPVGPNSTTTAELVARNVSSDIGAYEATISVPEASGLSITAVNTTGSPAFADTVYSNNNTTARVSVVGRTSTDSGSSTLATVTLETGATIDEGEAVVSVSDANVSTEGGDEITVSSTTGDTVSLAALDPVGDFESPPTDPDGDGVYEDVNGDGTVTVSDVQAIFTHRDSEVVTEQRERFDVTGNGVFNIVDVQRLFYTTT
ncbi:ZmpA/ZmpB/ZmpC family metallo-endopeptidase-related protein [Haloferax sp. ATB1]|uniref:ZmpA/ZmpB/ZmpC family metallo-endopeptidase-related protein n=1 Tax=Haloferax sp. ATB1 TaxID=1508454 RepID=UPI000AE170DE|nr:ZmpA/ZmpB/ZmpC family metallo-endopeptidase-related protein [Haloferax sp. ATB1]